MESPAKILFILKYRECYGLSKEESSSGLLNSARFVTRMLESHGVEVKLVQVNDNNDIDREVYNYRPTHVIVEAFWVVPEKFEVLRKLHPKVKWVVRAHSELPFFAMEGIAMDWLIRYSKQFNVIVAANSHKALKDFRIIIGAANPMWPKHKVCKKVIYLPNFFPAILKPRAPGRDEACHIGCFGAVRPLKNQLIQAVAAIKFAEEKQQELFFHINGSRPEQGGEQVLKNLRSLFEATPGANLVEHPWMTHDEFTTMLNQIDIGLQVTFSETFNIVAADCVKAGIPIVVSSEVKWASRFAHAKTTDCEDIVKALHRVTGLWGTVIKWFNLHGLQKHVRKAEKVWLHYFNHAQNSTINSLKEGL